MIYWTQERIIAAIQRWAAEHDGEPPLASDWKRAAPHHPARVTAEHAFGKWNTAISAAGFTPRRSQAPGPWNPWSKDDIAAAFLDFLLREGRWPTSTDCGQYRNGASSRVEGLPCWQTVYRRFGSFPAAKRYAGWDEDASTRTTSEPGCASCGCELDNVTFGCKRCHDRKRRRTLRASLLAPVAVVGGSIEPPENGSPHDRANFATASDREAEAPAVERRKAA